MGTFITEPMTEIRLRLEATEGVMKAAETKVFGPRYGHDGMARDQHWSADTWEPFDEDDYPPDVRTRYIEINPATDWGREHMVEFWAVAAACGTDGEVMLIARSASTYCQAFFPARTTGEQAFVRISSEGVSADLERRIAQARAALMGDSPVRPRKDNT